jgi:hypothetical protein
MSSTHMATFSNTMNIVAFAQSKGLTALDLIDNPNNGKQFAKDSLGNTYRVSNSVSELTSDLMVSWFAPDDGDPSLMIHPQGESNVKSSLTFAPAAAKAVSAAKPDGFPF